MRSGDTGQWIPCFDSCQLITTLMCNQFSPGGLPNYRESVRVNIGFFGANGRSFVRSVYGHVITKFFGMGRFTYPWCSAGARFVRARAPLSSKAM